MEHIVVEGGSTDESRDVLERYARLPHIRVMEDVPARGQSAALNVGFRAAKGEIIAWLHADDRYCDGAFAAALDALADGEAALDIIARARPIDLLLTDVVREGRVLDGGSRRVTARPRARGASTRARSRSTRSTSSTRRRRRQSPPKPTGWPPVATAWARSAPCAPASPRGWPASALGRAARSRCARSSAATLTPQA